MNVARHFAVVLCAYVAAMPLIANAATAEVPYPARSFARFPTFNSMQLSPSGRYLAVSARVGEEFSLAVLQLPEKKVLSGLRFRGESAVGRVYWASDERILMEMAYQADPGDPPAPSGELFAMNADGGGKAYLFGFQGEQELGSRLHRSKKEHGFAWVQDPLPDDPQFALVSIVNATQLSSAGKLYTDNFTPVYKIDVQSGRKQILATAPMFAPNDYLSDAAARVLVVSGNSEDSYQEKTYYKIGDAEWVLVPIAAKQLKPLRVSKDGRRAYFRREEDSGRECLLEWPLPMDSDPVAPREVICRDEAFLGKVYFDGSDRPYGYRSGHHAVQIFDSGSLDAQVLDSLQKQFPGQVVDPAGATRNHGKLMFNVYSDRNSGEYYLYDAAKNEASFLDAAQSWLDPERMATVKPVEYQARDGLKIEGLLTLPLGRPAKQLPMVVLPHGGPIGVADAWGWDADAQFMASRGYAVLQMNFRGSGGRGEQFERLGYHEWGGKIIDDITDGARWAIKEGVADPKRVCIFGASYGGYAAIMSAVREPELYRCAIGYAGVYDLNTLYADSDVGNFESGKKFWTDSMGDSPEMRTKQSPISYLDRLRAEVMIVHGELDYRSPVSQAKQLRKALEARKLPYIWLVKRDEGHGFYNEDNRTDLYERLETFLGKHLGVAQ